MERVEGEGEGEFFTLKTSLSELLLPTAATLIPFKYKTVGPIPAATVRNP